MVRENGNIGVLFVDGSEESKRLLAKLAENGLSGLIEVVDVSKNSLRGWLLLEYGTSEVPLLVTEKGVLSGSKSIEEYINKLLKS
ncbi:glutathione S-transferase N-terminal domain-containing protein [Infirmifilum sp. SLHALR2]